MCQMSARLFLVGTAVTSAVAARVIESFDFDRRFKDPAYNASSAGMF